MTQNNPIVILSAARTPIGNLLGSLKELSAPQLAAHTIQSVLKRANLTSNHINEVIMGCVLPAGQGQAPTRQAALIAGLAPQTTCTTINKVCGSGMKAIMLAHDLLRCHSTNMIIAGGMESMTHAPYLMLKARSGYRFGNNQLYDHMILDGLEDAYEKKPMGFYAEECAKKFSFSRQQQDEFAIDSFERAIRATEQNIFSEEIIPISIKTKKETLIINKDEHPFSVNLAKIPSLSPAFVENGTVTAGNSSSIADGAASLLLTRTSVANEIGIKPIARILGHCTSAKRPDEFPTTPIDATQLLLSQLDWQINDVDLFEVNEAFAVIALAFISTLKIPREKVNINGGACALGHPIGASGARIIVTLINALRQNKLKRGIATLCIGGGEATAIAIETNS